MAVEEHDDIVVASYKRNGRQTTKRLVAVVSTADTAVSVGMVQHVAVVPQVWLEVV